MSDILGPLVGALRYASRSGGETSTRLATVTDRNSTGVLVQFDGEATASTRRYMTSHPVFVGMRVMMVRVGSTWVVNGDVDGDADWIDAPLANGWTHFDMVTFGPVQYRRNHGVVHVRGLGCWNTSPTLTCWVMPTGYRPERAFLIAALTNLGTARLDFKETGAVVFPAGTGGTASGTGPFHSFAATYPAEA